MVALLGHAYLLGFVTHFGLFGNGVDAVVYRHGGSTVLGGEGLYSFSLFDTNLPFTYPPFAAIVFVVLALMPVATTMVVVDAANLALLYSAVVLSWRLLGYRGGNTHLVSIGMAIALTWLEPVRMTLWLGQINLLLLVLVLWDLGRAENSRLRGIGTGLAAGLKLTPAFFVVYLLALRQWRAAIVAVATFATTVVCGFALVFGDAWSFWTSAVFHSDRIGLLQSPANQSIHGALARGWPGGSPPFAVWALCAALVGVLGLWASVVAYRRGARLLSLTLCGMTTPMVSPFSWGHHWVWCVPMTVLILHHATRGAARWRWAAAFASVVPFVAWYWTAPGEVAVIGTFMFWEPGVVGLLSRNAYVVAFALCLVGMGAFVFREHALVRNDAPRLQLLLEIHRRMSWTRRRQADQRRRRRRAERAYVSQEAGLRLRPVEEDALDESVRRKESGKIVDDYRRIDDRRIETSGSRAQFQYVPHSDAVV